MLQAQRSFVHDTDRAATLDKGFCPLRTYDTNHGSVGLRSRRPRGVTYLNRQGITESVDEEIRGSGAKFKFRPDLAGE
jgi:hypothetical protein